MISLFLVGSMAATPSQGQIADLNFDDSSGHYNAVSALTGIPKTGGVDPTGQTQNPDVTASITFNQVAIGEATSPKNKSPFGNYFSDARIQGRVSRQQANPSSTYTVVPQIVSGITASGTVPSQVDWTASTTALYRDAFYFNDTGNTSKVLGVTFATSPSNIVELFPSSRENLATSTSLTLTFESPNKALSPTTLDVPFSAGSAQEQMVNIEFDRFGPDNLFTMTLNLDVTSTFTIPAPTTEATQTQAVNWIDDSFTDLPFATISLSDSIAGAATKQFEPLADAPGPPSDTAIVPTPSAAAAGVALLALVVARRRRR
ncbi:MAG: MYXO-CTERM sorting domain-containing protein [Planctomycetota bacterium]